MFVLAWTIGDASSLACQSLNQVHFVYSSMSSGLLTQSMFNSNIGCGTTEKVVMEPPPWIFGFMPLPTVALGLVCLSYVWTELFFEDSISTNSIYAKIWRPDYCSK